MAIIIGGVECSRVPGYPKEDLSLFNLTAVDVLQCAWGDRIKLAEALVGFKIGNTQYYPQEYNNYTTTPLVGLYVNNVKIEPVIGVEVSSEPLGKYTKAQLTITYGTTTYEFPEPEEETYISESIEPAAEFLTLSEKGLYWGTGANKVALEANEAPAKIIRLVDWVYTLHQVKTIPNWIWTLPGCINSGSVTSRRLNKTFAAETLLCGNPALSREVTSEGTKAWALTARMTYRPPGWNKWPRTAATGGDLSFESIYDSAGTAKKFYETASFGSIVL